MAEMIILKRGHGLCRIRKGIAGWEHDRHEVGKIVRVVELLSPGQT